MALRLPVGAVTVLLGAPDDRAAVMAALDPDGARCAAGHAALPVARLTAEGLDGVRPRLDALADVTAGASPVVLVDHLTDGLTAGGRRAVLAALPQLAAAGRTVLVDDLDPVAALATADAVLRTATMTVEPLTALEDLARSTS